MKFVSCLLFVLLFTVSGFAQQKDSVINKPLKKGMTFLAGLFLPLGADISVSGAGIGAEFEFPYAPKASFMLTAILNGAPQRGDFNNIVFLPHISIGPRWYSGNSSSRFFSEVGIGLMGIAGLNSRGGGGGVSIHFGLGYSYSVSSSSRIIVKAKTHAAVIFVEGGHPGIGGMAFTELQLGYGIDF
jgi:hypothetical protein